MLKNLDNYFNDFIIDRVTDIEEEIISDNKEVKKLKKDSSDLFKKILRTLPKEEKNLIFRYEEKINETDIYYFKMIYKQGFIDGLKTVRSIFHDFDYFNKSSKL